MKKDTAIFAAGCFWGVQYYFDQVSGVIETTVGYIGGHVDHPSYEQVCGHTTGHAEAVKIVYDPIAVLAGASKASAMQGTADQQAAAFRVLLKHFFRIHDPTQLNCQGPDIGDNYRSAIFYKKQEQKRLAQKMIVELNQKQYKGKIVTTLEPADTFWPAEDKHQKFTERTGLGACHVDYTSV